MRQRKQQRQLPACVYQKHGAYWLVKRNKWHRLAADLPTALAEYARLHEQKHGGMPALIEQAIPTITAGKAASTQKLGHAVENRPQTRYRGRSRCFAV